MMVHGPAYTIALLPERERVFALEEERPVFIGGFYKLFVEGLLQAPQLERRELDRGLLQFHRDRIVQNGQSNMTGGARGSLLREALPFHHAIPVKAMGTERDARVRR